MTHLKRLVTPWNIPKHSSKFSIVPRPTKSREFSVPIGSFLRDILKDVETLREAKYYLMHNDFKVNGVRKRDVKHVVSFQDIISVNDSRFFRIDFDSKGHLVPVEIKKDQAAKRYLRLDNKRSLKGNKLQLNCFGGFNVIIEKDNGAKVGDTLIVEGKEVKEVKKLDKGSNVTIIKGKNRGVKGTIASLDNKYVFVKDKEGNEIKTLRSYAYVVE